MRTAKPKPGEPSLVRCPPAKILAVTGQGSPESPAFDAAIHALYGVAYAIRFARKAARREPFTPGPLEGLWSNIEAPRDQWQWKLIMRVPHDTTAVEVRTARAKKSIETPVRIEVLREGQAVEALHVGPYATEPLTIHAMRAFMAEHHLRAHGVHHEIYLGDPRRTAPARLKTILRQPVARAT